MLMSFRACVFCARASVTAALGFLIIVPMALCWNILLALVRHMEETELFILLMLPSNWASETSLVRYEAKRTLRFF